MDVRIDRIPLGVTSCYLVRHEGVLWVDCGMRGAGPAFRKALEVLDVRPEQVGLILLTHGHDDHVGSACEIADMTGAKIALHRADADWLGQGRPVPARAVSGIARLMSPFMRLAQSRAASASLVPYVVIGDEGLSLEAYGIPGKVVHTPGHTAGSFTLILTDGRALVGDMAMNGFPLLGRRPGLPIVADDLAILRSSWRALLEQGVVTAYPGHGGPFATEAMLAFLTQSTAHLTTKTQRHQDG
jgi:hydroxyacylglutathione hydrolase